MPSMGRWAPRPVRGSWPSRLLIGDQHTRVPRRPTPRRPGRPRGPSRNRTRTAPEHILDIDLPVELRQRPGQRRFDGLTATMTDGQDRWKKAASRRVGSSPYAGRAPVAGTFSGASGVEEHAVTSRRERFPGLSTRGSGAHGTDLPRHRDQVPRRTCSPGSRARPGDLDSEHGTSHVVLCLSDCWRPRRPVSTIGDGAIGDRSVQSVRGGPPATAPGSSSARHRRVVLVLGMTFLASGEPALLRDPPPTPVAGGRPED